jgi:quercetin dioxygenase-like cupin family protein
MSENKEIRFFRAEEVRQDPNTNCKSLTSGQLLLLKHAAHSHVDMHSHKEAHIIFVRKGNIKFTVDNQVFEARTGDTLVVPRDTEHCFDVVGDEDAHTVCLALN